MFPQEKAQGNLLNQKIWSARLTGEQRQREVHPIRPQQQPRKRERDATVWWERENRNRARRWALIPEQMGETDERENGERQVGEREAGDEMAPPSSLPPPPPPPPLPPLPPSAAAAVIGTATAVTIAAAVSSPSPAPPKQATQPQISQRAAGELGAYIPGPEDGDVQRERKSEGVSWPAGAGRKVETGRAERNAYWQNSLPGLMRPFARGWLTREMSHPMTEERENAEMGAGGGVCIIGWKAEHRCKRRRCQKRARMKEQKSRCQQQEHPCSSDTYDFVDYLSAAVADSFRFLFDSSGLT